MNFHHRRSIRLPDYDYSSEGAYFVTVVAHHREPLFGEIVDDEMVLNDFGRIVREEWLKTAQLRAEIELVDDEFVIMPNHFHGIVNIIENDRLDIGRGNRPNNIVDGYGLGKGTAYGHGRGDRPVAPTKPNGPNPKSLGALTAGFKSAVTMRINILRNTPGAPVWQRNYYEHIINSDREYEQIAAYIANNPSNWLTDDERNPR